MKTQLAPALVAIVPLLLTSCANFRKLGKDLKLVNDGYRVSGIIVGTENQNAPVKAVVVEWDRAKNKVHSADLLELTEGGAFAFVVKSPLNQYAAAHADTNRDGRYQKGEPFWMHRDPSGQPQPVALDADNRVARVRGALSASESPPQAMLDAIAIALNGRDVSRFITHQGVRFALGEKADLNDPQFAATRGEDGLWTPATFAMNGGFGIYFLERYDPEKIPVLFIHGAAGSPQDWRHAMERIEGKAYQPWFYVYPSGMRLDAAANALNKGVGQLHERYGFRRLHVAAHSMGGLVARRFIQTNALADGNDYIRTFISYSSPWGGHEAAAMGVRYAPQVVPSWRDMAKGSEFLDHLFDQRLKGRVDHHLFFSHRAARSRILPPENDGTVSVASQKRAEALGDAVETRGFDEDHLSVLSSREALKAGKRALDASR
jgi:pimeloyl-ACP methyl ester carboxylesterase/predicted small secreted protein